MFMGFVTKREFGECLLLGLEISSLLEEVSAQVQVELGGLAGALTETLYLRRLLNVICHRNFVLHKLSEVVLTFYLSESIGIRTGCLRVAGEDLGGIEAEDFLSLFSFVDDLFHVEDLLF